ncbi:hypothetical protein GG496_002326 [Candidatus Fervidibacteria bacterium JGI MDM2 JNZ-1-D12]
MPPPKTVSANIAAIATKESKNRYSIVVCPRRISVTPYDLCLLNYSMKWPKALRCAVTGFAKTTVPFLRLTPQREEPCPTRHR